MKRDEMRRILETKRRAVLLISIIIVIFLYVFRTEHSFIRAIGALSLLTAFYLVDHLFYLNFERKHYLFIILIAVLSFPMGFLYLVYLHFDKFMHFIQPIMLASIVFFMISKLKIELKWRLVFTFFVVVGTLGVFEIGEYFLDTFFGFRLQGIYI